MWNWSLFFLVNGNDQQVTDLWYAWGKGAATSAAMADWKAIRWALAIYDINPDLHLRINGITRRLFSASIFNRCKTVVDRFRTETTARFGCTTSVQCVSNSDHSARDHIAVVDRMARDAFTHLQLETAVFSVTLDGLRGERIE